MTASARPERPTDTTDDGPTVDFGFRRVREDEKASLVRGVFDSVAPRYDLMNDLMSLGVHRLWKGLLIDRLAPRPGMRLIDVGGGTGDIALRFLERGGSTATVVDINADMLAVGRDRAIDAGRLDGIDWLNGDAEALPVASASFDACTAAFSLRNVTHPDRALAEVRRVLMPGGRFLCLEFSPEVSGWLEGVYDAYSFNVLPLLGRMVAGDAESYRYLAESIRRFPTPDRFTAMIAEAGLERASHTKLSGGIAVLYSAWRL
jgi:demethylmenaquinone methyltransferase/2-methoxy-6-polyprenyl-1,4-benzoquinol methylase